MSRRYYVEPPISSNRAVLAGPEAHHLSKVMRARPGEEITLFDGLGQEMTARIVEIGRSTVELEILSSELIDRELGIELVLGIALPKGDRARWAVEKATELGVTRLVPLKTERGIAQPTKQTLVRLRRAVIEASKQCGRNQLMAMEEPLALSDFAQSANADFLKLTAHPGAESTIQDLFHLSDGKSRLVEPLHRSVFLAIGPEGGFSDQEIAQFSLADWKTINLGSRILRIETAAIALAAVFAFQEIRPDRSN